MSKLTKFFKHPVMFFEDAAKNKNLKEGKPKIFVVGFSTWKTYLRMYFSEYDLIFLPKDIKKNQFNSQYRNKILSLKDTCQVFIWGFKAPEYILEFLREEKISTKFVEDGFVRSVQLGATKAPPMSLCLDSKTPYFDATRPSELEDLLNNFDFSSKPELLSQAKEGIKLLVETGVSKYNNSQSVDIEKVYGTKTKKRILVLGQVEDDASIQYGCEKKLNNNDVVRLAVKENPDAQVIYKPHPDVMNGHRPYQSNPADVEDIALVLAKDVPLADAFESVDHVYTITSLGGFEALLRGILVTTLGCPFYSGWGLTDDRQINKRRKRSLSINEIFAVSYLYYPKYFNVESGNEIKFFEVVEQLECEVKDKRASAINRSKNGKTTISNTLKVPVSVPDWFQPDLTSGVREKIRHEKPVFLYLPWIAEHGNSLIEKIKSDSSYDLVPFDLFKGIDPQERRREIFRFAKQNPSLYKKMVKKRLIPLKGKVQGFIFTFDWAPIMRIIAQVCKELDILTVLIPHESVFVDRNKYYWDPYANASVPICDLILGWGELQREIFIERGYPEKNFISVGAPKFDVYVNYQPMITRDQYYSIFGLDADKKTILFASQPLDSQLDTVTARESQRKAILDLFDYVKNNNAQLIVRLPPSKDNILTDEIIEEFNLSGIAAIDDAICYIVSPEETIYHVDAVSSINSTMLFEGVLCGKPSFSMKYVEFDQIWENAGIPAVRSYEELNNLLFIILSDKWVHPQYGIEWAANQFGVGRFDGKACFRIKTILQNIVTSDLVVARLPEPHLKLLDNKDLDLIAYSYSESSPHSNINIERLFKAQKAIKIKKDQHKLSELVSVEVFFTFDEIDPVVLEATRKFSIPIVQLLPGTINYKLDSTEKNNITSVYMRFDEKLNKLSRKAIEKEINCSDHQNLEKNLDAVKTIVDLNISNESCSPMLDLEIGAKPEKIIIFDNSLLSNYRYDKDTDYKNLVLMIHDINSSHNNSDLIVILEGGFKNEEKVNELYREFSFINEVTSNNLYIIDHKIHNCSLFKIASKVAVIDSLAGFEAIMHNKTVVCYGEPIYSGWGLTIDKNGKVETELKATYEIVLSVIFEWIYIKLSRYSSGHDVFHEIKKIVSSQ